MESKVTVSAVKGNVFTQSMNANGTPKVDKKGKEHGFIRIESYDIDLSFSYDGGVKTRSALIAMSKEAWEELKMYGFTKGMELPGKIVVKESTTPFSEENPDQHLKIAGETGIVCCLYGEPIYRITYYTADPNEQDEFVQHDNVDAIRSANGVGSSNNKISAQAVASIQEAFDLKNEEEVDDVAEEVIVDDVDDTFEL